MLSLKPNRRREGDVTPEIDEDDWERGYCSTNSHVIDSRKTVSLFLSVVTSILSSARYGHFYHVVLLNPSITLKIHIVTLN